MAFQVKNWQNYPGSPSVIDGPSLQDLETRLSGYSDLVSVDTYQAATATTTATTLTIPNGNYVNLLMGTSTTLTFTLSNAGNGTPFAFSLNVVQDAIGNRLMTWPSSVKWSGGASAVLSTGANKTDIFSFYTFDGGTTVFGFVPGLDMR